MGSVQQVSDAGWVA